nr:MAG TPA: hypothetical protein [Caudoviricetes sp.]
MLYRTVSNRKIKNMTNKQLNKLFFNCLLT